MKYAYVVAASLILFQSTLMHPDNILDALRNFDNQLTALANMLQKEPQEAAVQIPGKEAFMRRALPSAPTAQQKELTETLFEETKLPAELVKIAAEYVSSFDGILEGTLNNEGAVRSLLPLPDETLISSSKGNIKIWNLHNKQLIRTIDAQLIPGGRTTSIVAVSLNTFASGSDDGSIKIWNLTTGELVRTLGEAVRPSSPNMLLAMRRDGKLISAFGSIITIWDPNSGTKITTKLRLNRSITSLGIAPNDTIVLAEHTSTRSPGTVTYLNAITLQESQAITLPKQFNDINIVVFPHGGIAAASHGQTISILPPSAQQGAIPQELSIGFQGTSFFSILAVLSDGRLASGHLSHSNAFESFTHDIIIWNYDEKTNTWNQQLALKSLKNNIFSLAALSNGGLVSGDEDGNINIWR